MGRSTDKEIGFERAEEVPGLDAQQKLEIVLAGLRGDVSVKELCRRHEIAETLYHR
jgi:transposase-like protein